MEENYEALNEVRYALYTGYLSSLLFSIDGNSINIARAYLKCGEYLILNRYIGNLSTNSFNGRKQFVRMDNIKGFISSISFSVNFCIKHSDTCFEYSLNFRCDELLIDLPFGYLSYRVPSLTPRISVWQV